MRAIVQFAPARQTQHRQDRLVVSGGRFELGMEVTGMGWGRRPYLVPVQLSTGNCERSANAIELHFVVVHVKMN